MIFKGHIRSNEDDWHLLSDGRVVSFHTAFPRKENTDSITFCSDSETWPSVTAQDLGIRYAFMRNATHEEIVMFLDGSDLELAERT